jgi:hypothetical protein
MQEGGNVPIWRHRGDEDDRTRSANGRDQASRLSPYFLFLFAPRQRGHRIDVSNLHPVPSRPRGFQRFDPKGIRFIPKKIGANPRELPRPVPVGEMRDSISVGLWSAGQLASP